MAYVLVIFANNRPTFPLRSDLRFLCKGRLNEGRSRVLHTSTHLRSGLSICLLRTPHFNSIHRKDEPTFIHFTICFKLGYSQLFSPGVTSIPEHRHLGRWWDTRARGLGGTLHIPVSSGAEENLLCYSNDRYRSEDIFLHEFSHGIQVCPRYL